MSGLPAHISISCSSSVLPLLTCAGHCRQRINSIRSGHVWSSAVVAHVCKSCSFRQGNGNHVTCSVLVLVLQFTFGYSNSHTLLLRFDNILLPGSPQTKIAITVEVQTAISSTVYSGACSQNSTSTQPCIMTTGHG